MLGLVGGTIKNFVATKTNKIQKEKFEREFLGGEFFKLVGQIMGVATKGASQNFTDVVLTTFYKIVVSVFHCNK